VVDPAQASAVVEAVKREVGDTLDIPINNAGQGTFLQSSIST
jgi:hypothetical protein